MRGSDWLNESDVAFRKDSRQTQMMNAQIFRVIAGWLLLSLGAGITLACLVWAASMLAIFLKPNCVDCSQAIGWLLGLGVPSVFGALFIIKLGWSLASKPRA